MEERLRFRRQFVILPFNTSELGIWKQIQLDNHFLYVHPDCESFILRTTKTVVFIGFIIDPTQKFQSNQELAEAISECTSVEGITEILYPLSGRFILLLKDQDKWLLFGDACGLKSLYYLHQDNSFYAASDPSLINKFNLLKPSKTYDAFFKSKYRKEDLEYFPPVNCTLFREVHRLMPNHYYDSISRQQIRFWPVKKLTKLDSVFAVSEFSKTLTNTINEAAKRFKLALPITAGWDSRILLSTSKKISKTIFFYTLKYRNLTANSPDIKIPRLILSDNDLKHHVLDCSEKPKSNLMSIFKGNSYLAHENDWGKIVCNMLGKYPEEYVALKGSCCEIGRRGASRHSITDEMIEKDPFVLAPKNWLEIEGFKKSYRDWFKETYHYSLSLGYDIRDLFYWEHRMGSWQSQSQLEWDMVQEELSPFNNRMLLDLMLRVDIKDRIAPDYSFFETVLQNNWSELLEYPLNPKNLTARIKSSLKNLLLKAGFIK